MTLTEAYHVSVPTAFYSDESLNTEATIQHILSLKKTGICSVLLCGSMGEQHSLTLIEKLQLLEAVNKEPQLTGSFELLFGVSSIRQKEAVLLTKEIEKSPTVAGILLGFPPYILPSQEEAVQYVQAILQETTKPVLLYNNPKRTGFDLSIAAFSELMNHQKIIGIKEAGDLSRLPEIKKIAPKGFFIYAGGEHNLSEKIDMGVNRLSSISGNLYPLETRDWFIHLLYPKTFIQQTDVNRLRQEIEHLSSVSPIVYLKNQITETTGIPMGICRMPLGN